MDRKILSLLFLSAILFVSSTAQAFDERNYDFVCDYQFYATPVVHCVNNNEFEHNIYYFSSDTDEDNKCLVVICHGFVDNNGYGIFMHNQYRYDYPQAIAESLAYWTGRGKLRNVGEFNYVFMHTCHTGYARASTTLPMYGMNLVRAIDYKGINAFSEEPLQDGQVLLKFYRVVPKNRAIGEAEGALSRYLKRNNVRGYRSVNHRSASKPKGIQILYGEL